MKFADRVKQTTTSTSAAVITLSATVASFRTFAAAFTVGDANIPVSMDDGQGRWENGAYTLTSANTLTRTAIHSSSNGGQATVFQSGAKDVFCTLTSEALDYLIGELRAEIGGGSGGPRDIAFSTIVPLSVSGQAYMPQQRVSSALTFTAAASAVRGALVYLRLVADGANIPNFSAFKEWGGSLGYDNTSGIVNEVQFYHDGYDSYVSISQAIGAVPVPPVASAVTLAGPTTGTSGTASAPYTVGTNGPRNAAVTVTPTAVSGVTFNPTSVTLPVGSATATFTATSSTTGAKSIAVTNSGSLTNPAAITFTVAAPATVPGAPTIGASTAGSASASVAFTAPASNGGSAVIDYTVTASPGGATATGTASPISVTGLTNGTAYTFTVRARNVVGSGTASAASNSVTPVAVDPNAPQYPRLVNTAGFNPIETGPAPYDYSARPGVTGVNGIFDIGFLAGVDGFIAMTLLESASNDADIELYAADNSQAFWLAAGWTGSAYGFRVKRDGGAFSSQLGANRAVGDIVRISKTGTSIAFERSNDGTNWTTMQTYTGANGPYKVKISAAYATFADVNGKGLG